MWPIVLIRVSGIISLVFVLFHFAFPLMPEWQTSIHAMHAEIRNIFITYHYGIIAFIGGVGFISTFQARKLIVCTIKNSLMILFSSIYLIRIVTEFVCWKAPFPQAVIVLPLCIIPIVIFFFVLIKSALI